MRRLVYAISLGVTLLAPACGGGDTGGSYKELEAAADAALRSDAEEKLRKAREADEAKRKQAFDEKKKQDDEAKAQFEKTLAEIVILPEQMPKSVDAACKELTEAFHEFMLKAYYDDDGALLDWYNNRKAETLGERRGKCVKVGSLEAAACQIHALRAAPQGWREKELDVLRACIEKYAPEKAAAAAADEAATLAKGQKPPPAAGG
jgi:hypothetical protein